MLNKYMFVAIEEARYGITHGHGGPFGAVVVKDGEIIGRGHNQVILNNDPTCHGEMMAIHDACKRLVTFDLSGCEIYTTGEPCPMCMGSILWANFDKVYFGCNILDTEDIGFRDNKFYNRTDEEKKKFSICLDRDECLKLYAEYKSIEDKKGY